MKKISFKRRDSNLRRRRRRRRTIAKEINYELLIRRLRKRRNEHQWQETIKRKQNGSRSS